MAEPVSNRRRILAALACQETGGDLPFLPWGLDALAEPPHPTYAPLFAALRKRAAIKRRWLGHPDFIMPASPVGCHVEERKSADGATVKTTRLSGPGGELCGERRDIAGTTAGENTVRLLKSAADAELYTSWPFADPAVDGTRFFSLDQDVGERGVVTVRIPTGLGLAGENFEPEPFALCTVENPEVILALVELLAARVARYVSGLLEAGARPIFILSGPEFATPPLLSPRAFDQYVARFDAALIDLVHRYGCAVVVHCHGRLDAVLERFVEMGVDGLHPLEAPPMGDVALAEVKRRVRDRVCLLGNLQIGDMMSAAPSEIRQQVRAIRREVPRGMILTTSATPYELPMSATLFENYLAAIDAATE